MDKKSPHPYFASTKEDFVLYAPCQLQEILLLNLDEDKMHYYIVTGSLLAPGSEWAVGFPDLGWETSGVLKVEPRKTGMPNGYNIIKSTIRNIKFWLWKFLNLVCFYETINQFLRGLSPS